MALTPELFDGGIWRIPLPMPFGPPFINVYLLPCPGGWMLIDTGLDNRNSADALAEAMAGFGVEPSQLRHIVLTHLHADHCARASHLRDLSGATVWMHPADAAFLLQLKSTTAPYDALDEAMRTAGTPDDTRIQVRASYEKLIQLFPMLSPDALLEDGVILESWIGPLQVLWTPGHSPGHCCLYAPERKVLFAGDHVIDDITPHIGWLPGQDTLGQYLGTLDRLDQLDVELILSSHGQPFTGLREWTRRVRDHHAGRTAELLQHQQDGVIMADDLVRRLWPRELRPLDYQLALTEVLAHLEHARR
ncbi:MAG: MBL fold metallo-hydrolase [Bryobacterales bacterium]|nr:MBL fold metallo-hydrolase [Bryobacterales bacterium]